MYLNGDDDNLLTISWKRSKKFGVDPLYVENNLLTGGEIKDRKERLHNLFQACSSILEQLYLQLKDSLFMLLVADKDGYIIFNRGDSLFIDRAKKVWLDTGANWSEKVKGTNAIGTAIIEQKPVSIIGKQHFCKENQFLTCYAAPLYSPTGDLLGVINVSGDIQLHHPHTLGMVMAAAQACQSRILLLDSEKELTLYLRETDTIANKSHQPLISIDPNGTITRVNFEGAQFLEKPIDQCIGQPLSKWISKDDMDSILTNNEHSLAKIRMNSGLKPSETKILEVQPIQDGRKKIFRSILSLNPKHPYDNPKTFEKNKKVWDCPKAKKVLQLSRNVARTSANILIQGETGTGKEIIAREIHQASERQGPLIAINCGAIPEELIESELFGYEKGAFTGAKQNGNIGKFEAANKGTLFLDEIGDMPLLLQTSLLRVLEEKRVTPIGSHQSKPIDVRIIAATNRDLIHEINKNQFRSDLYYRLCEFELTLPSLRERTDLFYLAEHFLNELSPEINVDSIVLDHRAQKKMADYYFPGNIRELRHVLRQAAYHAFFSRNSTLITDTDFNFRFQNKCSDYQDAENGKNEEEKIAQIIQESKGNMSQAARLLGIGRTTLYRKIHQSSYLKNIRKQFKSI
ncbi:sigma-54-dependent Fis family transcriptional regulator [Alteribacillus sp. JSM 102045]|uniref:sigma-54-dependent Fis family transcriptional regulator n=1 Tax=Alteribacillus sp. JSM 102045 TaxID=1562101 RepID=UPI0035C0A05A